MKNIMILISFFAAQAFSADTVFNTDKLKFGRQSASSDKVLEFNANLGALNPKVRFNYLTNTFELENGDLSVKKNNLSLGDGTNTDKVLKFNKGASSPEIRYNSSNGKLEFSNDASVYKAIGSGGGGGDGGVSLLENGSFEDGITVEWSNTGGTFSSETYTNGTSSDSKYARLVASGSGQYFETSLKTIPDSLGSGCMADLKYFGGSGNFKLQALDSSSNVLSEITLINSAQWIKSPVIAFPCPAAGSTMRARVISTAAGTINADSVYFGGNKNLTTVGSGKYVGGIKWAKTALCDWTTASSASYIDVPVDSDCPNPITIGEVAAPGTKVPGLVIPVVSGRTYQIAFNGQMYCASAGGHCNYRLNDGTDTSNEVNVYDSSTIVSSAVFTYRPTTSGLKTLRLQSRSTTTTTRLINLNNAEYLDFTSYDVFEVPQTGGFETAVTNEQSSWLIDVNIGGASVAWTTLSSTYAEITNANLDMVVNSNKGSAAAKIPCSSTNPSTGLTCAVGSESIGVVFTPPYAGIFDVCASFPQISSTSNTTAFQFVETPNNAQTILQEGGVRISSAGATGTAMNVCGTFNFSSTSERTIRLMFESPDSNSRILDIDRSSAHGQRDMRITVRPALQNIARPVLTGDQVTQKGVLNPKIKTAKYSTGACSNIVGVGESWISVNSGTNLGASCSFNIIGFSSAPVCFITSENQNSIANKGSISTTSSTLQLRTLNSSTFAGLDTNADIVCIGF